MNYGSSKSAKTVLSKSIFDVKNQLNFFEKDFHLRISIYETNFKKKHFFLDSIFEPLYFLKLCPIFDELTFLVGFFFLGPTIFKIPQSN